MTDSATIGPRQAQRRRRKDRLALGTRARFAVDTEMLGYEDGRRRTVRRLKDIAGAIAQDQGGADRCSEAHLQLIRRFATACLLAEQVEGQIAAGKEPDAERFALICSTLCRLAARVGIDRVPRDVSPSLSSILRDDLVARQREGQT